MRKIIISLIIINLIILVTYGLWWIVKPELKPVNNAKCLITNKGHTLVCDYQGQKYIVEVKK